MTRRHLAVALLVPEPVASEVDGLRRALGDRQLGRVAPHVTLVPPVSVREDDLAAGLAALRAAAVDRGALRLTLGPVTTFAPVSPVLYLAVDDGTGGAELASLQGACVTGPFDRPATHAFVPHVTVSIEAGEQRLAAAPSVLRDYRAEVGVDRLHLLEERDGPGGARVWEPVADVAFGRPAVVGRGALEVELWSSLLVDPEVAARFPHLHRPADEPRPTVVARRGGDVLGLARARPGDDGLEVIDLAVSPDERGSGVDDHLVARLVADAGFLGNS